MDDEYTLTLTASPEEKDVQAVREGLDAHATAQGVPLDWLPLALFLRDTRGQVVGGLTGGTYWGWLYLGRLWVAEPLRGRGHGRRLLVQAEQEALRRGCHHVYLDTQDFQAPDFYLKQGYREYGRVEDMPLGHTRYSLQKEL